MLKLEDSLLLHMGTDLLGTGANQITELRAVDGSAYLCYFYLAFPSSPMGGKKNSKPYLDI